jgi:hypothetical protein
MADAAAAAAASSGSTCGEHTSHDVIDYASKAGSSIWCAATLPLSEDLFDCIPEGLRDFLQLMSQRGNVMGWDSSVLFIPDDSANPVGPGKYFARNYGNITWWNIFSKLLRLTRTLSPELPKPRSSLPLARWLPCQR